VVPVNSTINIFRLLATALTRGEKAVLVTVVDSTSHAPGKAGFKMLVLKSSLVGSVGGGAIEHEAINIARELLLKNEPPEPFIIDRVHRLGDPNKPSGMICGGSQTLSFHVFTAEDLSNIKKFVDSYRPDRSYEIVLAERGIWVTYVTEYYASHFNEGVFTRWSDIDWYYREVMRKKDIAYIIGGGHIGAALAPLLRSIGFHVTLLDDRENLLLSSSSDADTLLVMPFKDTPAFVPEGANSYAFIMTPSHAHDETVLRGLLHKNLSYLGMVASKQKVADIFERLRKSGVSEEIIATIHSPIGLPIKSRTPAEIAISIAAEVIQIRNTKK
jgi:xanthine dehydrogenase accessory factor